MVERFIHPVLLCLVLLMGGGGNAARDFNGKYTVDYLHKTTDDFVKDLKDKDIHPIFYKKRVEMNDLEDKNRIFYFHKGAINDVKDVEMKDLEDKYKIFYFHRDATNDAKDVVMKDFEDKYKIFYFHRDANIDTKDVKMKDLKDKYKIFYFHKSVTDEMKGFEDKYKFFYFHKSISDKMKEDNVEVHGHTHDESAKLGLFTLDQLHGLSVGKKLPIFFPIKDHSLYPHPLPKEVADTIPFSSSHLFSVSPDSPKGKAVQDTLKKCELEAAEGETKVCAPSLESLNGFLSNAFGPEVDIKFLSPSHPTLTTPILQSYTVLESPREIESAKKVACHPMPYLYAVYFCHFDATESKAFKLQLVGDITGDKVDALVLCHMDTSGWSSDHVAFRMLGIKHGDAVCHVFSQGNVVWINQPSIIAV